MGKILDGRLVEYCYVRFMTIDARPGDVKLNIRYDLYDENKVQLQAYDEEMILLYAADLPSGQIGYDIKEITKAFKDKTKDIDDAVAATKKDKSGYEPESGQ